MKPKRTRCLKKNQNEKTCHVAILNKTRFQKSYFLEHGVISQYGITCQQLIFIGLLLETYLLNTVVILPGFKYRSRVIVVVYFLGLRLALGRG